MGRQAAEAGWHTGLVFGKFMPVHEGHVALVRFAAARCQRLIVLVCSQPWEPIDGSLRLQWMRQAVGHQDGIEVHHCTDQLPYSGLPSLEISSIWGEVFRSRFPELEVVFTSEAYGDELASLMGITHLPFDPKRHRVPISAQMIRDAPMAHWTRILPIVRPYFVRKVCLFGAESVGKSTLAAALAQHFGTVHVAEAARALIPDSRSCRFEDLRRVAESHALAIRQSLPRAERLLLCDTDLLTTQVYAKFLFAKTLAVEPWISEVNHYHLHLFCESDLPYVQDGSRLGAAVQPALRAAFLAALETSGLPYEIVHGDSHRRLAQAIEIVNRRVLAKR